MNNQNHTSEWTDEQAAAYAAEAEQKYGKEIVRESQRRVASWGKEGLRQVVEEGKEICRSLVALMDKGVEDKEVQDLIARHHQHINRFYDCTLEIYGGLSDLYVQDPRFRAHFAKFHEKLPEFLSAAMKVYGARQKMSRG